MRVCLIALTTLFITGLAGCQESSVQDQVVTDFDEKEMDKAIAQAKSTIEKFIAELKSPTGEDHAVKVAITDDDQTEYFWMTGVTFDGSKFTGTINNEPMMVDNVKEGQSWSVEKADAVDWMYIRDGKMYGNRTMIPLLPSMSKDEADLFREMLADPTL